MKLGYVIKAFPRLSETFILNELLELQRQGCSITIFSRYPGQDVPHQALGGLHAEIVSLAPLLKERFWEGFLFQRHWSKERPRVYDQVLETALAYRNKEEMRYWLQAAAVAVEVQRAGIEHLHAHFATGSASVARYAAALAGIPFSVTAHAKDIYAADVDCARLADLLKATTATVTVSDANVAFLRALTPEARIERVYNGIDLERFPLRTAPAPHNDPPLLLFVGRLVEKKGVSDLLLAMQQLAARGRKLRLRIVGGGELEPMLRQRTTELGLDSQVEWAGPASQEQLVAEHLAVADLFVLPAIVAADGDRDGLPTTLVEAMACGVPVITTEIPGVDEAAPDPEAGWLVPPNDPTTLAQTIERVLADPDERAARALRARERVELHFDVRKNVPQLMRQFRASATDLRSRASA
jgi:glycosyltransferase involved in cell wall biosynthesis